MAYRILFVGSGDSGREVMAKAIVDDYIRRNHTEGIEVKARGMVVLFQEPVNSKVSQILDNNHISLEYDCVFQLEQADIDDSDLIIVMEENQKQRVCGSFQNVENIFSLKELAGEEGELLDPYGKDLMDYEYSFRELSRLLEKLINNQIKLI